MCGIAGFTQLHSQSADVAELIRRMTSPLTPRGPDGEGFHVAPGIALGHRRLSDLASLFRTFEVKLGNAFAKGLRTRASGKARHGPGRSFPRRYGRCDGALVVAAHQLCAAREIDDASHEQGCELC